MATIYIHNEENTLLENEQEVQAYLEQQGVIYEHWDIEKLPKQLSEKYDLTDDEKEENFNCVSRGNKEYFRAKRIQSAGCDFIIRCDP